METTSVPSHCSWISVLSHASPHIQYIEVELVIIIPVRVSDHFCHQDPGHEHHPPNLDLPETLRGRSNHDHLKGKI